MAEAGEELYASFEYNADLFDAVIIEQMAQSFGILLEAVVANPSERIFRLPLLGVRWPGAALAKAPTSRRTPSRRLNSIHHAFERQAAATPEATAVVFDEQHLSYRELNKRANK